MNHEYVRTELEFARLNEKPVITWAMDDVDEKSSIPLTRLKKRQWVERFNQDFEAAFAKLCEGLAELGLPKIEESRPPGVRRELELAYLKRLKQKQLRFMNKYTPVGGGSQRQRSARMRIPCSLEPFDREQPPQKFADAVEEIQRIRRESGRAVLLGDPGGGKTTILWKLADGLVETALADADAPIPVLVRLGLWTTPDQPLPEFIAEELAESGKLDRYLDALLANGRVALLLDGLNELPVAERPDKFRQIREFIKDHRNLLAVVSCRKEDYAPNTDFDLGFDRIIINPLDSIGIRDFVARYLENRGETLFWALAGEGVRRYYDDFMRKVGPQHEKVFWVEDQLTSGLKWTYDWDDKNEHSRWPEWISQREAPASLMVLARNPYMLWMLTRVYAEQGELPENRGDLFRKFVKDLLEREQIPAADQASLTDGLAKVAFEMQSQSVPVGQDASFGESVESNARTALSKEAVSAILDEQSLKLAGSASLLSLGDQVRFTHQLLQEYFAAKFMDGEIRAGRLKATDIWRHENWWKRTNWEEAAMLLAGLYRDDCSNVVEWIAEANPEVAAQCVVRSGAALAETTRERLREDWKKRLTDLKRDPEPLARAAIGRALGLTGWDNRKGVGVVERSGLLLPDIDWVEIPEGEFQYGDKSEEDNQPQKIWLPKFWISRFPVTCRQFQTFLDDPEGFNDPRWFMGMKASEDERRMEEQRFQFANHPRETVNWYQAMAFCRWLSWRLDRVSSPRVSKGLVADDKALAYARGSDTGAIRLPTEFEWEKAARGTDGRLYPYKGKYDPKKSNVHETGIGQPNAVGIFPNSASPYGVEELSGNVWEWCLSDYSDPKLDPSQEDLGKKDCYRVLRGGSWFVSRLSARAVYRADLLAALRDYDTGFRVVAARPPSS